MVTLFGMFETGSRALFAQQSGIAVAGNNISNVNTPGYSRQRVNLVTSPDFREGQLAVGTGVRVRSIDRLRNSFLDDQIRGESSRLGYFQSQSDVLGNLEVIFNDPIELPASSLEDTAEAGLNASLIRFFSAIQEVSLEPESSSVRTSLQQQSEVLVSTFNLIDGHLEDLKTNINSRINTTVAEINTLLDSIYQINLQVARLEVAENSDANNLRDQRDLLISQLSSLVPVEVTEMESGAVTVNIYGINAVQPSSVTHLQAVAESDDPNQYFDIYFEGTGGQRLNGVIVSGELGGLLRARDTMVGYYEEQLDTLAYTLIDQINRIHSGSAGLSGFDQITGEVMASSNTASLENAGLNFEIEAGSFDIVVRDDEGNIINTYTITVDPTADSLADLAAAIDAADGTIGGGDLVASVTGDNRLQIIADTGLEFTFQGDSSGVLSALGVNTFFKGSDAGSIQVSSWVRENGSHIAVSSDGTPGNNDSALLMAGLQNAKVLSDGKADFHEFYQSLVAHLGTEGRAIIQQEFNTDLLLESLEIRQSELAGVSLDEETIKLLEYQRAFSAASRFITSIDEMIQIVIERMGLVGR